MPWRLRLPGERLLPIEAFFNAIGDGSFVQMVDCLTQGIGYSTDDVHCHFPSDLDPGEPSFHGIRFSLFKDQVVVSLEELRVLLSWVVAWHLEKHPGDRELLEDYLNREIRAS